jgi:ferredoxin
MAKEFYIKQEECISCGTCAELCPNCFTLEDGMAAEVVSFDCPEDDIQEAMDSCPSQCIDWSDDD